MALKAAAIHEQFSLMKRWTLSFQSLLMRLLSYLHMFLADCSEIFPNNTVQVKDSYANKNSDKKVNRVNRICNSSHT